MERTFSDFLADHSRGRTNLQLTTELQKAIKAAGKHNKAAEVTVKIKVTPQKGMILLGVAASAKLPAEDPDQMMYYADDDGNPCIENPHQMSLPLRRLEDTSSE